MCRSLFLFTLSLYDCLLSQHPSLEKGTDYLQQKLAEELPLLGMAVFWASSQAHVNEEGTRSWRRQ